MFWNFKIVLETSLKYLETLQMHKTFERFQYIGMVSNTCRALIYRLRVLKISWNLSKNFRQIF
jgi:hypothetical protein